MPMLAPTKNSCPTVTGASSRTYRIFSAICETAVAANVLDDNQELVTAEAANRIGFPHQPAEPPGHLAENAIADLVAKGVVDVLEAVEIDEQHGQSCLVTVRTLHGLVQSVAEQQAVGQTRSADRGVPGDPADRARRAVR
jgi:hypothetical protein